jgi:uncharacterized protein GlcG (DUF336 family)
MVGSRIGGINVFGGGLALYGDDGTLVDGVGVSGDRRVPITTSRGACATAWDSIMFQPA